MARRVGGDCRHDLLEIGRARGRPAFTPFVARPGVRRGVRRVSQKGFETVQEVVAVLEVRRSVVVSKCGSMQNDMQNVALIIDF